MRQSFKGTWIRLAWLVVLAAGVSGCSQMERQSHVKLDTITSAQSQPLQGQLSIKLNAWQNLPAKGMSFGFFFTGDTRQGLIDFSTPLGTLVAQVGWSEQEAWTTNQDGRTRYDNIDDLSIATLGEIVPIRSLTHWMHGQPDPSQTSSQTDIAGIFEQAGWQIDLRQYAEQRIQATRESTATQRGIQIKIYLDR